MRRSFATSVTSVSAVAKTASGPYTFVPIGPGWVPARETLKRLIVPDGARAGDRGVITAEPCELTRSKVGS